VTSALRQGLARVASGWALIPIRPRSKEPHFEILRSVHGSNNWSLLARSRASESDVRRWFEVDPQAGMAVITGEPSRGLVVVDFDRRPAGTRLVPTPFAWTPGRPRRGLHVYVTSTRPIPTTRHTWGEVRGFGAPVYTVLPPSTHPCGRQYEWALAPEEVDLAEFSELLLPLTQPSPRDEPSEEGTQEVYLLGSDPEGKDDLRAFDADEACVRRMAAVLGITSPLGQKFLCVLPGHEERHPSAALWRDDRGLWVYRDFHGRDERRAYALAEVYASRVAGRVICPNGPSLSRWKVRLLAEAGLIQVDPVALPPLPRSAPRAAKRLRDGLAVLFSVRWWQDGGQPVPYAASFAGDWNSVSKSTALRAIGLLLEHKVMVKVGETSEGGRRTNLYLPGGPQ
jgi:hypothetical protein